MIFCDVYKTIIMNKEFNGNNYQPHSHQEGQQNNIAREGQNRNVNEPPSINNVQGGANASNQRQEGEDGRNEGLQNAETESDLANENEDEGVRGGNSSI